jgi:hypothetical protein
VEGTEYFLRRDEKSCTSREARGVYLPVDITTTKKKMKKIKKTGQRKVIPWGRCDTTKRARASGCVGVDLESARKDSLRSSRMSSLRYFWLRWRLGCLSPTSLSQPDCAS